MHSANVQHVGKTTIILTDFYQKNKKMVVVALQLPNAKITKKHTLAHTPNPKRHKSAGFPSRTIFGFSLLGFVLSFGKNWKLEKMALENFGTRNLIFFKDPQLHLAS